jgi:hypothetical protein
MKAYLAGILGLALTSTPMAASAQVFSGSPGGLNSVGEGQDCFPRKVYDQQSHESITIAPMRGDCGGGYIKAENRDTGGKWRVEMNGGGFMTGVDEDGAHWRYNPKVKLFTNLATGRSCKHSTPRHVCADPA